MLEIAARNQDKCGEGPIWDPQRRRLLWDDLSSSLVFELSPASGETRVLSRDLMVSAIALHRSGELVFAGSGGIHLWHGQGRFRTLVSADRGEALCFNDILADPLGRLYAGTYCWGAKGMEKHGRLYLVDTAGALRVVDEGIELANGLGFSPDNRTLYFADSSARRIYAYDVDPASGSLSRRRVFVQVPREEGLPDGLTVDREGFVWCAQWYGAQVVRYDPDGRVERRIAMPVTQVSSVAFGGDDLDELYVTTAAEPWPSDLAPPGYDLNAPNTGGALYRLRPVVRGKPEHLAALA
jgi:D-xylonolactonase